MQVRGPLMIEHRVIERMIARIKSELQRIKDTGETDPHFIDSVVDFVRVYADRTHHGKEEDILFRDLEKKPLPDSARRIMQELVAEHQVGRRITSELVSANDRYRKGDQGALDVIREKLNTLVDFYPGHIEKEDKVFFPACQAQMTVQEQETMLQEFLEFDAAMIHEKYRRLLDPSPEKVPPPDDPDP